MQSNDTITQTGKQQRITKKLKSCEFNNTLVGDLCKRSKLRRPWLQLITPKPTA